MSNWYQTDDWYAPLHADTVRRKHILTEKERRKRRRGRIAGALILALLFAAALRAIVQIPLKQAMSDHGFGNFSFSFSTDTEEKDLPENFSDFFASYYTPASTVSADVRIAKTEEKLVFVPELVEASGEELSLSALYERCAQSIVGISGYQDGSSGYSWGTGVVLSEDGLILTNTHVIDSCDRAEVTFSDGASYEAFLVGADTISDLAILKIEASNLKPAMLGDSSGLKVGEPVAAIGNPLGDEFTGTLTDGIISAIDRDISYNGRSMTLIQTNTALNEGNSGGALFNRFGQVIGITNMKMMSSYSSIEGIGFAIPSATVKNVAAALIRDGEVKGRPSIGITVGSIPEEIAEHYHLPSGLYVAAVSEGSDAEAKGIREGDIVLAVDGEEVTDSQQIVDKKDKLSVGDTMSFTIWREETTQEITITLMDTNEIYR